MKKFLRFLKIFFLIDCCMAFIIGLIQTINEGGANNISATLTLAIITALLSYSVYKDYNEEITIDRKFKQKKTYTTSDGILIDDDDNDTTVIYRPIGYYMDIEEVKKLDDNELPRVNASDLILKNDEFCCFMDIAMTQKIKTITKGYRRKSDSVRVLGTSWRTGTNSTQAIRGEEINTFRGTLYLTNERIIYVSQGDESFDKPLEKVTAIQEGYDGIIVQIGSKTHIILLDTHVLFMQVLNLIKNKKFGIPLPQIAYTSNVKFTVDSNVLKLQK